MRAQICNDGITRARSARFHLIDLAGSERQRDTAAAGERLKEARTHTRSPRWCSAALTRATQAGSINKSLSALAHVINALVEVAGGRRRHVHYRDSKLTFLLKVVQRNCFASLLVVVVLVLLLVLLLLCCTARPLTHAAHTHGTARVGLAGRQFNHPYRGHRVARCRQFRRDAVHPQVRAARKDDQEPSCTLMRGARRRSAHVHSRWCSCDRASVTLRAPVPPHAGGERRHAGLPAEAAG